MADRGGVWGWRCARLVDDTDGGPAAETVEFGLDGVLNLEPVRQQPADTEQRVASVSTVAEGLLLHAVADLVRRVEPEPDDAERVSTRVACGKLARSAVAYPRYGSSAATAMPSRQAWSRAETQSCKAFPDRLSITSSSRGRPLRARRYQRSGPRVRTAQRTELMLDACSV